MWADKHAPLHIRDVIMNNDIRNKLDRFVTIGNVQNIIITGPSGTGKTVLLNCIARDIYKSDYDIYVRNLNTLLEGSNTTPQDVIETFCKSKIVTSCEKNKMLIIDDIDNIPDKIHNIIAFAMEKYRNVSFAFSCNDLTILETIQSRCIILRMQRPTKVQIIDLLKLICKYEKYEFDLKTLEMLWFISQGDIRLSVNNLQLICEGFGCVTLENVKKICDTPDIVIIRSIIELCIEKNIIEAIKISVQLCNNGYTCSDVLSGIFEVLQSCDCNINDAVKFSFGELIGKTRYMVSKKVDSKMQLIRCIIGLCNIEI